MEGGQQPPSAPAGHEGGASEQTETGSLPALHAQYHQQMRDALIPHLGLLDAALDLYEKGKADTHGDRPRMTWALVAEQVRDWCEEKGIATGATSSQNLGAAISAACRDVIASVLSALEDYPQSAQEILRVMEEHGSYVVPFLLVRKPLQEAGVDWVEACTTLRAKLFRLLQEQSAAATAGTKRRRGQ